MAFVPLNQRVVIEKSGALDDWGRPIAGERITYKARVEEEDKVSQSAGGENHVYSIGSESTNEKFKVHLEGLVSVTEDDTVYYTNELGQEFSFKPKRIVVKRWLSGKPLFTVVYG
jgi:hypothetical protein